MTLNEAVRQLSFATTVAAALSITACSSPQTSANQRTCTDRNGLRTDDQYCRSGARGGGGWYYGGNAGKAKMGEAVRGGSYTAPRGFGTSAYGRAGS